MRPLAPPPLYKWTPPSPEERAAELQRAERAARIGEWKLYGYCIVQCFAATFVGCVIAGFGFAVTDPETGQILLLAGGIVSWTGNLMALGRLAIRVDRGDV
jgi:hypothetical protein